MQDTTPLLTNGDVAPTILDSRSEQRGGPIAQKTVQAFVRCLPDSPSARRIGIAQGKPSRIQFSTATLGRLSGGPLKALDDPQLD